MIDLSTQLKLIIFSFIFGFLFSLLLEMLNNKIKKCSVFIEILTSFVFIVIMTFIYFIGIEKISNAIFHIYSILSIILGFITYNLILCMIANNNKK